MRKQVLSILAVIMAVAICTSSVAAVSNQGLVWGMSEGQRFDYTYHREVRNYNYTTVWHEPFYNVIEELTPISDDIDSVGELPYAPNRTCYYENGTQLNYGFIWYAIPIGNWDMIIDLWITSAGINESDIINSPQSVGYNATWSWDGGNSTYIYAEIYSRSTGVLQTYQAYNPFSDIHTTRTEITLTPSFDMPLVFILAGGAVAAIVVAIVLLKRR